MAGHYDFLCEQGATFTRQVKWRDSNQVPVDLTSYTARMQVRSTADSSIVALSLTTENGGITLGGTAGTVDLLATATQTAAIEAGDYVYDLELVFSSTVYRVLQGCFVIDAEVTR